MNRARREHARALGINAKQVRRAAVVDGQESIEYGRYQDRAAGMRLLDLLIIGRIGNKPAPHAVLIELADGGAQCATASRGASEIGRASCRERGEVSGGAL